MHIEIVKFTAMIRFKGKRMTNGHRLQLLFPPHHVTRDTPGTKTVGDEPLKTVIFTCPYGAQTSLTGAI